MMTNRQVAENENYTFLSIQNFIIPNIKTDFKSIAKEELSEYI